MKKVFSFFFPQTWYFGWQLTVVKLNFLLLCFVLNLIFRYTSNCLALVTCMNDEHRLSFLKKIFNPEELIHFRLK